MVLIMITTLYPPSKAIEVGLKYLEVTQKIPYESYEEPVIFGASKSVKDGMRIISIIKIKKGMFDKAYNNNVKRMLEFVDIEGLQYIIETLLTFDETMALLGLNKH